MSGRPKNEIMSPDEMRLTESRKGRLYSQTADHGMVVAAIVSNLAAGIALRPLGHEEVIAAGEAAKPAMRALVEDFIARL